MLNDKRILWAVVIGLVLVTAVNWPFLQGLFSRSLRPAPVTPAKPGMALPPESLAFPLEGLTIAVSPEEGSWLAQAHFGAIEGDPFRIRVAENGTAGPERFSGLTVTAVLTGGEQNVAIINGETVGIGDRINGLPVIEIQLDRVVLGRGAGRLVLPVE